MLKYLPVGLGIVVTLVGHLADKAAPDSWLGRILAPRFAAAKSGLRALLEKSVLSPQDQGFQEILQLAIEADPRIASKSTEAIRRHGQSALDMYRVGTHGEKVGAAMNLHVLIQGEPPVSVLIWEPENTIKARFFDAAARRVGEYAFWVGILISVVGLAVAVLLDLRAGPRAFQ